MTMKIAYPGMGSYTNVINKISDYLGWELVHLPPPSEKSIELGTKYMASELMCLPAKATLGSMIGACEQGVTDLLMFDSCGLCRLKTYWILQERALRKLGYDVTVHPIRLGWRTPIDIQAVDSTISYWKACLATVRILHQVIELDKRSWYEMPKDGDMVKVGIVGEIYTILEPAVNMNLIKKMEKMDVLVHNSLPLSYFIFKGLYDKGWMERRDIDRQIYLVARRQAHQYFPKEIGGHGNESIIHTIYYAMKKFDGVIHIMPFPCMPESTVAPILDDISHDYGIPVMRLIFDTHTGEGGVNTRLEAFVDILKRKKVRRFKP